MAYAALQPLDTCRQEDKMRASFLSEVMKQKSQKTSSSSSSSSSPSSSPSCCWLTSISLLGAVHIWCQAKIGWSMKTKVSLDILNCTKKSWTIQKNWHIYQKNRFFCVIYLLSPTRSTTLPCSRRLIESTIGSLITWITLPSFVFGKTKTAQETAEKLVLVFFLLLCQDRVRGGRPGLHKVPLHWQVPDKEVQVQVAEY